MEDDKRAEGFWWVRVGAAPYRGDLMRADPATITWRLLWYFGESLMSHDPRDGGEFVALREMVVEWGHYLGKEPAPFGLYPQPPIDPKEAWRVAATDPDSPRRGDPLMVVTVEGARPATPEEEAEHERQRQREASMVEGFNKRARTSKLAFNPSADYEGEDTRALDGAGVVPSIDALVRVVAAHEDGPPVGTEGRLYRIDTDEPRYKLAHHGWARGVEVIGPPPTPEQRADDVIRTLKAAPIRYRDEEPKP